ncbi:MAG: hypothetical protein KTR31_23635 [Myxococcales bacterium]|nr:hypothetical protein [Myxococcales bacterium]
MIVSLFLLAPAQAQQFMDPLTAPTGPTATAILTDGSTIEGKPNAKMKGMGNIKKLKLKKADGTKVKLAPGDLQELQLTPGGLAKAASAGARMGSISSIAKSNIGASWDREYVVYLPGTLPNGKPALLQILNPHFSTTIEVFPDPAGRETGGVAVGGVAVTGGVLKSYLVRKAGEEQTMLVKKGKYDNLWDTLFADCPDVEKPEKPKWGEMAATVYAHAAACGPQDESAPAEEMADEKMAEAEMPEEGTEEMTEGADEMTEGAEGTETPE